MDTMEVSREVCFDLSLQFVKQCEATAQTSSNGIYQDGLKEVKNEGPQNTTMEVGEVSSVVNGGDSDLAGGRPYPQRDLFLFDQFLKAGMTLVLAVGFISAAANLARRVVDNNEVANHAWAWVGLLKAAVSSVVVLLVLYVKGLGHREEGHIEHQGPSSTIYFYTVIVIAFVFSWLHLLLQELRNFFINPDCLVTADYVLPISEMLFLMAVWMHSSDLLRQKIKVTAPRILNIAVRASTMLLFVNCVNSLLFDVFDVEFQHFHGGISSCLSLANGNHCHGHNSSDVFLTLIRKADPGLKMFSMIFFISIISLLVGPISQIPECLPVTTGEEEGPLLSVNSNLPGEQRCPVFSIVTGVLAGLTTVAIVPLDAWGSMATQKVHFKVQLAVLSLPLAAYIVSMAATAVMLWLHSMGHIARRGSRGSSSSSLIVWVSLWGQCISCLKSLINCYSVLGYNDAGNTTSLEESFSSSSSSLMSPPADTLFLFLFLGSFLQSITQAVFIDLISDAGQEGHLIKREHAGAIIYPAVILMSTNVSFFIANLYLITGLSSFTIFKDPFTEIVWELVRTISDPLTIIFRGHSVLLLIRFLAHLTYREAGLDHCMGVTSISTD